MEPIPTVPGRTRSLRVRLRPSRPFLLSLIALRTALLSAIGTAGTLYLTDHRDFDPFHPENWQRLLTALTAPALFTVFAHFARSPFGSGAYGAPPDRTPSALHPAPDSTGCTGNDSEDD